MFLINIPAGIIIFLVCMKNCKTKDIELIDMTLEDLDKIYNTKKIQQKGGGGILSSDVLTQQLTFSIFLLLILKVLKFGLMKTLKKSFIIDDNQSTLHRIILYEILLSCMFTLLTYILSKNISLVKMMLVDSILSSICYTYTKDVKCYILPFFLLEMV